VDHDDHGQPANHKTESPAAMAPWLQSPLAPPKSRLGKGGAFALVALAHVSVLVGLASVHPQVRSKFGESLQVVMVTEPEGKNVPPPTMPLPRLQNFDLPVDPVVLDIADPDASAISVRSQPEEAAQAQPTQAVATPKVVSSVEYVREPAAKYPASARVLKQHGTVTLRALIDPSGRAREVVVHQSSGFRTLDDAGRQAVLNALFKPYTENGQAQAVYVFIPIEFGMV